MTNAVCVTLAWLGLGTLPADTDLATQAQAILKGKPARLFHYGVSDDLAWTVGLSCGGEVDVLIEPLTEVHRDLIGVSTVKGFYELVHPKDSEGGDLSGVRVIYAARDITMGRNLPWR